MSDEIKRTIGKILSEGQLNEQGGEIKLSDIVSLCQQWDHLGSAIQEQLEEVIAGGDLDDQNPDALRYAADWLDSVASLPLGDATEDAYSFSEEIRNYLRGRRTDG